MGVNPGEARTKTEGRPEIGKLSPVRVWQVHTVEAIRDRIVYEYADFHDLPYEGNRFDV